MHQCLCGFSNENKWTYGKHWRSCETFWQCIYDELRRINKEHCDGGGVSLVSYDKYRQAHYPRSAGIGKFRAWGDICAMAGIPTHRNDPTQKKPEKPKPPDVDWGDLLEPGKHIGADVPIENLYNLLIGMVTVAHQEAAGIVSHHSNVKDAAGRRAIQQDAQQFIERLQNDFMRQL